METKRKARKALVAAPHISQQVLQKILQSIGEDTVTRRQISIALAESVDVRTPYGALISEMSLVKEQPQNEGDKLEWHHTNPFALFHHLCSEIPKFFDFLRQCYETSSENLRRIAIFTDEACPGNVHHPDLSRQVQCYYFTLTIFPHWFRRRKHGWFPFGYMRTSREAEVEGHLSHMLARMLHVFFSPVTFSFLVGVRLRGQTQQQEFTMVLKNGPTIQDMKAHQHINAVRGSAGLKCCIKCKAVVNQPLKKITNPYFQHYALATPDKWDMHTKQSYVDMAKLLTQLKGAMNNGKFEELQKAFGLNYEPNGVLFDPHCIALYSPAENVYEDSCHSLYASGGNGAYEVNGFVHAIANLEQFKDKKCLEILDSFAQGVRWPVKQRLNPNFFQERVRNSDHPIKAFAVECMAAITVLDLFATMVLDKAGLLPLHCKCMHLLSEITDLLSAGDRIVPHSDKLEMRIEERRALFVEIYGLALATPKLHHLGHVAQSMKRWQVNLDCRPMETMHGPTKRMSEHMMNVKSAEKGVLKRILIELITDLADTEFQAIYLENPVPAAVDLAGYLRPLMPDISDNVQVARRMETHAGTLHLNGLLHMSGPGGNRVVGKAKMFFGAGEKGSLRIRCFIAYQEHVKVTPTDWSPSETLKIAPAESVIDALPHCNVENGNIRPLFPKHGL